MVETRVAVVSPRTAGVFDSLLHRVGKALSAAAEAVRALITPVTFALFALGLWRLGVDLNWTEDFPIQSGLFSHWQVWIALAVALQFSGSLLQRVDVNGSRQHIRERSR